MLTDSREAASKVIASYKNTVSGHESDVICYLVEAVDALLDSYIFNITTSKGYGETFSAPPLVFQSDGTVADIPYSISETTSPWYESQR